MTDADVVRACTIGNRAVASRGSSRLSPRRKSKEPLSRRVLSRGIPSRVKCSACVVHTTGVPDVLFVCLFVFYGVNVQLR